MGLPTHTKKISVDGTQKIGTGNIFEIFVLSRAPAKSIDLRGCIVVSQISPVQDNIASHSLLPTRTLRSSGIIMGKRKRGPPKEVNFHDQKVQEENRIHPNSQAAQGAIVIPQVSGEQSESMLGLALLDGGMGKEGRESKRIPF